VEHLILDLLKSHRGRIVVSMLALAACCFFALLSWPQLSDAKRLATHHMICAACVTNSRYTTGLHYFDGSYDLQYVFQLTPHGRQYVKTENGPLARKDLWDSLPKDQWKQAITIGSVNVAYDPEDPNISCLENDLAHNFLWIAGGNLFLVVAMVVSFSWLAHLLIWGNPDERRLTTSDAPPGSSWLPRRAAR
jgi:hypothetical protein